MTVIYEPKETTHDGYPNWSRRTVSAHTNFTHKDREFKGHKFTVEKSEHGVEIEFQTNDGDFSRIFTHDEFDEFIKQCQWVAECPVTERKVEAK